MRFVLVTADFAPRTGSHATRTVHLAKCLRQLGHSVAVVTYDENQHALYGAPDRTLAAKVPIDVEVCRVGAGWIHRILHVARKGGRKATDIKRHTRHNPLVPLLLPDPHFSARRAFEVATLDVIRRRGCDVLITCAYPFTMTLVGAAVKRARADLTWIADYADPWSGAPFSELRLPKWRRLVDHRLEGRALTHADAITVTTEPTASLYRAQFPNLEAKIEIVSMGYDPDDATRIQPAPRAESDKNRLVLLHAGRLNTDARDPGPFISALEACAADRPEAAKSLKVVLLGDVDPQIATAIQSSRAAHLFEIHGWVDGSESIARMKSADLLLLFGNRGAQQIPGKVFQYIGTGRPIFMTCETPDDPTAAVVRQYGSSRVIPNEAAALERALREMLDGAALPALTDATCGEFSWPRLAEKVAQLAAEVSDRHRLADARRQMTPEAPARRPCQ